MGRSVSRRIARQGQARAGSNLGLVHSQRTTFQVTILIVNQPGTKQAIMLTAHSAGVAVERGVSPNRWRARFLGAGIGGRLALSSRATGRATDPHTNQLHQPTQYNQPTYTPSQMAAKAPQQWRREPTPPLYGEGPPVEYDGQQHPLISNCCGPAADDLTICMQFTATRYLPSPSETSDGVIWLTEFLGCMRIRSSDGTSKLTRSRPANLAGLCSKHSSG